MSESNDLASFVVQRMSVLVPPLDRDAVLELSTDIIFTESQVVVFLVQVNKSLEETKQTSSFWTQIKHLGNYSKDAVSSQRWLSVIRHGAHPSSAAEDSVYARPLALALLTRLLSDRGGVETARRLLWWGLVRELAPYASGRYLPKDPERLNRFCVARVASVSRLAIMAVHLFRAVTPGILSSTESMADRVRAALLEALRSSPWLRDGPTRNTALLKAASMALSVGFPKGLSRESELDAYFAPLRDLRANRSLSSWLELRRFLQRRKSPADDATASHVHKVNAYYLSDNRVMVPAGIIQEPVYFHGAADAYNYGSLGQALSSRWARCRTQVERDMMSWESGLRQDPENLGDFSGARLAYEAFQSLPDRRRALSVAGFGSERLFFIGHCVKWCRSLTEHRNEGYARGRSRCIVPLMHMPEFSEAFGCGAKAYMNPERKCSFW
ncbi:hypothetical protein V5799_005438 [Amblyomma americanum]|uniref:M13 family peptidase n=1 Tax=Amblyomma americanum TaxID=6943 RepID=A0AAQ4DZ89_AMBAM